MKKIILVITVIMFFAVSNASAQNTDSVDVKALVKMQILAAQLKQLELEQKLLSKTEEPNTETIVPETELIAEARENKKEESEIRKPLLSAMESVKKEKAEAPALTGIAIVQQYFTSFNIKIFILITATLLAAGIVIKRRLKLKKISDKIKLKDNVKALRKEQLVVGMDPRLKSIRKRLCMNSEFLNKPEKEVILAARRYQISKEELYLASRLNMYQLNEKLEARVR